MATNRLKQGSDQQERFWDSFLTHDTNKMLQARAGTGKSSSMREAIWRLVEFDSSVRTGYVAFNKSIAQEFAANLPPSCTSLTMHSAGYKALRDAFPEIGQPCPSKMFDIADSFLPRMDNRNRFIKKSAVKLATVCKANLIGHSARELARGIDTNKLETLAAQHSIFLGWNQEQIFELTPKIIRESIVRYKVVDFSDMVWLPVVMDLEFPAIEWLFVDEAQDLDPCQHSLVQRMAGNSGKLCVVGDDRQAIYAFRGADSRSLYTLRRQLERSDAGLTTLPLTKTRRCPSSHVDLAKRIVGDFESFEGSPKGSVSFGGDEVLTPGTMGVCRNNAPLISTAFRLVAKGIPVAIQGKDIGESLANFVETLDATDVSDLMRKVEIYRASEIERLSALENTEGVIESVNDRCNCIIAVSEGRGQSFKIGPDDVAQTIRSFFLDVSPENQRRSVLLSSVHRAKGREAEKVAIIAPELMPSLKAKTPEQIEQEMNLLYVAITRSKDELFFLGGLPDVLSA